VVVSAAVVTAQLKAVVVELMVVVLVVKVKVKHSRYRPELA
jgi:hypothetical protein